MSDQNTTEIPSVFRRLWFVVLLTVLILSFPIAMVILLTGNVYRKRPDGWRPIGSGARYVYGGLLALWLVAATLKAVLSPGGISQQWHDSADPQLASTSQPNGGNAKAPATPGDHADAPASSSAGSPDMKIGVDAEYHDVIITADDDTPFSIQRVVLNGRNGEEKCDFRHLEATDDMTPEQKLMVEMRTKLPTDPMKRGDTVKFGSTCGETLSVTIYTDHGVSQYNIKE